MSSTIPDSKSSTLPHCDAQGQPLSSPPSVECRMSSVLTPPVILYPDDRLIMISALQHLIFCERQFALIHIEQVWEENRLTAEGRVLHESVDQRRSESRRDVRQATAVRISSRRLGLIGVMDMLEFHRVATPEGMEHSTIAVKLPRSTDLWIPFPVEYKRGKPKPHRADEVQLCAQAMCLEEMLKVSIPSGAIFYGQTRRRMDVAFDDVLRQLVSVITEGVHQMIASGVTPSAEYGKHCEACSLIDICRPKTVSSGRSARRWLEKIVEETEP